MSDATIIALIFAGCFVLWLILQRRQSMPQKPTTEPASAPQRDVHLTCETEAMLSPAYHNKKGWPAVAIEMLPPVGQLQIEHVRFIERVSATYSGQDLEDITLEEHIPEGTDLELVSAKDEVTVSCPTPRCKVVIAIKESVLERAREGLPPGYDSTPTIVTVGIGMELHGKTER